MTNALWYLGRGTGVVSLVLLTLVVALGVVTRSGRPLPGLPRFALALVHRNASLLAVAFLTIHVVSLLFDPYAQLVPLDAVLPFAGTYRPLWLGFGTLAVDLVIALVATSLLRNRLGARAWRTVHWLAYACWPVAMLHAVGTGTDRGSGWMLLLALGCTAGVLGTVAWRCTEFFTEYARMRSAPASTLSQWDGRR